MAHASVTRTRGGKPVAPLGTDLEHDDTTISISGQLSTLGASIGRAAAVLSAAAVTLRAEQTSEDGRIRALARNLVNEAKLILRAKTLADLGCKHPEADEIDAEMYRLYSQVLILAAILASDEAVSGDGICTCPEADALELAAEFAGADHSEGLYGRVNQIGYDLLLARKRSAKTAREVRS